MRSTDQIAGVILAGGKASRMNYRDKPLLPLFGKSLIEHVIDIASPQVGELIISVNRNAADFAHLALPLIPDAGNPFAGPLIGIQSAMQWLLDNRPGSEYLYLACFPADVPRFPANLVEKLASSLKNSDQQLAICKVDGQLQPLFSLWSLSVLPIITEAIAGGLYGPKLILSQLDVIDVHFDNLPAAYFFNVNTLEDLSELENAPTFD